MAIVLALEALFDSVVARFEDEETEVPNVFGWREPARRGAQQNRIVWVPGDPSGSAGEVEGARSPGGNPRALATLMETFTVYVEGRDSTDLENELAQYAATRRLFDAWYRAVYLARVDARTGLPTGRIPITIKSTSWMVDRTTRRHGATLRVVCTVQAMIPDLAYPMAEDVEADVDMELDSDADDETPNTSEALSVPPLDEV